MNSLISSLLLIFLHNASGGFPSILTTLFLLFSFFFFSFFSPHLAPSAMNMDRFEKSPREILNPEIQKVRVKPSPQPAFNEMQSLCRLTSVVYMLLRPRAHPSLPWVVLMIVIFFFATLLSLHRTCWCWRSRRYRLANDDSSFLNILTTKLACSNIFIYSPDFTGLCKL